MARTSPQPTDTAPGFDSIVHVPTGSSIDEAISASEDLETAGSGFTSAALTTQVMFEPGEASFPRIRLAQGLTAEVAEGVAKMGQWLFSGYEPFDAITVVPIMLGRSRNKRENPQDRDSQIVCSSSDGVQGVGNPGRACRGCPFAAFSSDPKTGRRLAPGCVLTYTYAVWCPEVESFAEVSFSRTSEQAAHLVNNLIQLHGLGKFAVRLTSTLIRGRNTYAVPQVRLVPLTPEIAEGAVGFIDVPGPAALAAPSE